MAEEPLKVRIEPNDQVSIPFHGTVAANSMKTLVSKRITYPFRMTGARIHFALGTDRTLQVKIFLSPDPEDPDTEEPTGISVLAAAGQVEYVVGDDEPIQIPFNVLMKEEGMYLKLFANNTDSWEHTITGYVFITRVRLSKEREVLEG